MRMIAVILCSLLAGVYCASCAQLGPLLRPAMATAEALASCLETCDGSPNVASTLANAPACVAGGADALRSWCASGVLQSSAELCILLE